MEPWADINGGCYAFLDATLGSWNESSYLCEDMGGVLASVDSATTFRGIFEYIKQFGTLKSQVLSDRCNNSVSCGAYCSFIPPTS